MFDSLKECGAYVIGEVKLRSPFGKSLTKNSFDEQLELADKISWMISIPTDKNLGGSFEDVARARKRTKKKILAKGLHGTDDAISRLLDLGADYVLVVGRIPNVHIDKCFIEPLTLAELSEIPSNGSCWAVWNSRDLSSWKDLPGIPEFLLERWKRMELDGTQALKKETFKQAREAFGGPLCQASNLTTKADIEPGADAVLVGSNLETFAASLGVTL